jgi:hypothetical protein
MGNNNMYKILRIRTSLPGTEKLLNEESGHNMTFVLRVESSLLAGGYKKRKDKKVDLKQQKCVS